LHNDNKHQEIIILNYLVLNSFNHSSGGLYTRAE